MTIMSLLAALISHQAKAGFADDVHGFVGSGEDKFRPFLLLAIFHITRVNRVRSSRPSSRSAAATPFCRGYEASWRMISEAVTVPVRMDAPMRRTSDQW